jgi:hypothetical protein
MVFLSSPRVTTVNGVVAFSNVVITGRGRYRLLACAGDIGVLTDPFNVGLNSLRLG